MILCKTTVNKWKSRFYDIINFNSYKLNLVITKVRPIIKELTQISDSNLLIDNVDPVENYKYMVSNYSNNTDNVLQSLGAEFIEFIKTERQSYTTFIPQIVVTVAKYQAQRMHVIDPVISMLGCIYELQSILKE